VVEHDLAKVGVEGSNPFARSRIARWQSDASKTSRLPAVLLFVPAGLKSRAAAIPYSVANVCRTFEGLDLSDADIPVPDGGFSPNEPPVGIIGFCCDSRCRCDENWFRIVLRYGGVGGDEVFLDPDPDDYKIQASIKPSREGELFVNEPSSAFPGFTIYSTATMTAAHK
jgi:hypothetical protein